MNNFNIFSIRNILDKRANLKKNFFKLLHLSSYLIIFSLPSIAIESSNSSIIRNNPKEVIDEVWQIIYREYLDSSGDFNSDEWIKLRKMILSNKYADTEDSYLAIREMLSKLNDPYTRFLTPSEFKEMRIDTSGELMGVGIQITSDPITNKIIVVSPIDGSPASKAGVLPKDIIVSIDGKTTNGMNINDAVKMIRGPKNTKVKIGLLRESKLLELILIREKIEINTVISMVNKTDLGINIGYIRLKQFNANAAKEMENSIKNLEDKNVRGYVLDLRGNPGGLLEASIEIARQWIDKGKIVSTQTKDGINDVRMARGRALTNKPVVLIVNQGSASASEILSGAIRDNQRGLLVGEKTFGKGLVQSVRALSDGSGLTVTIAKYLTPAGIDINKYGLMPDLLVKFPKQIKGFTSRDLGTNKDIQYVAAEKILLKKFLIKSKKTTYNPRISNYELALKIIN